MAASQITPLHAGQQADTNTSATGANDSRFDGPALVPVCIGSIGRVEIHTVSARDLHAFLGISRDFNQWMREQIERARLISGRDYLFYEDVGNPSGGRPRKECTLTLDAAKHIAMMSGTEKGFEVRDYFIECERRAKAAHPTLPNFADPVAAARAWADAVEIRQQAEIERDRAIATKAEIGTRREATAMARASIAVREANRLKAQLGRSQTHATVLAVERASGKSFGPQGWRLLRKWCADHSLTPESVHDPRYGTVKAWPADAWGSVYGIDLGMLFPVAEHAAD